MRTVLGVAIHPPKENALFGEHTLRVRLRDEGGGGFLVLENDVTEMRLDLEELREVLQVAEELMAGYEGGGDGETA